MSQNDGNILLLALGKSQIEALFKMQMGDSSVTVDDSEFVPLVEMILRTFEGTGLDAAGIEQLWDYAYSAYDAACREAAPAFSFEENKRLMQGYLLGPRRATPRKKKRRGQRRGGRAEGWEP